jgi:hypothetical protein
MALANHVVAVILILRTRAAQEQFKLNDRLLATYPHQSLRSIPGSPSVVRISFQYLWSSASGVRFRHEAQKYAPARPELTFSANSPRGQNLSPHFWHFLLVVTTLVCRLFARVCATFVASSSEIPSP